MKSSVVVALNGEYENPDLITGFGADNVKKTLIPFIEKHKPDIIFNFGGCGSLRSELKGVLRVSSIKTLYDDPIILNDIGYKCLSVDSFLVQKPNIDADIVDCELYSISKICSKYEISVISYKFITDYVGTNTIKDYYDNINQGKNVFKRIYLETIK